VTQYYLRCPQKAALRAATMTNVELWLSFDDSDKLALSIPLAECERYAIHPLKWLRFLGYTIYGQAGHLSTLKNGPVINSYEVNIEARSYYYVSEGKLDCFST
jgi:hypothetical protein